MGMNLLSFSATDLGKVKDQNEDFYYASEQDGIFIIADGMGGHAAGEVASRMAIDLTLRSILPKREELTQLAEIDSAENRKRILAILEEVVRVADQAIYDRAQNEPEKRGMATTIDVLFIINGSAFIAHVGDSRVYLIRSQQSFLLTTDHTLANHLYSQGKLSAEEIEKIPHKQALMRALGMASGTQIDAIHLDLLRGDKFLLCTDGLSHYFKTNNDLLNLWGDTTSQGIAEDMIQFANQQGGRDNTTVILVSVDDPGVSQKHVETTQKIRLLQHISLFKELSYQEMLQLLPLTQEMNVAAGQTLIKEGESGDELFILLSGQVEVASEGVTITTLGPGHQFGELALVDDRPRSATIKALEASRLLVLKRNDFRQLTRNGELAPKLLWNLIFNISERLRNTSWQLTEQVRAFQFTQPNDES
jgi:serine/threonine protein phosphatase PrpC